MEENRNVIVGRNAVLAVLKSGRDIDKIFVSKGNREGSVSMIVAEALKRRIPVMEVAHNKLDMLAEGVPHQGVAAMVPEIDYSTIDDVLENAARRNEKPLIVIADSIEDPHNLGAIIRTAECAGAHGVVIPKRHSAGLTAVVGKSSAGAVEFVPIVKVPNLVQAVEELKKRGLWIFIAEKNGVAYDEADYDIPAALILGNEGKGVSKLLREHSDFTVTIPIFGKVDSLNVSNAAAVILYEIVRQRNRR